MQNTWYVYRHISPSNKVYVGITSRVPELRWGHNGVHYKECSKTKDTYINVNQSGGFVWRWHYKEGGRV